MKIGIKVDYNENVGLGHFKRCYTLAKLLAEKYQIVFFSNDRLPLKSEFKLVKASNDLNFLIEITSDMKIDIIVLDHYDLLVQKFNYTKMFTPQVVIFDDFNLKLKCKLIIRHNIFFKQRERNVLTGIKYPLTANIFFERKAIKSPKYDFTFYISEIENKREILNIFFSKNYDKKICIISRINLFKKERFDSRNLDFFYNIESRQILEIFSNSKILVLPASVISQEGYMNNNKMILYYESENQRKIFDASPNDSNIFKLDSFENLLLKEYDDFILTKKDLIYVPTLDKIQSDFIKKFSLINKI